MRNHEWSQEENLFLIQCYKSSYETAEANQKHIKKYKTRTSYAIQHRLRCIGKRPQDLLKQRPPVEQFQIQTSEERLKQKIVSLESQLKIYQRESIGVAEVLEAIHGNDQYRFNQKPKWLSASAPRNTQGSLFLMIGDIHHNERIESAQVRYMNEYNRAISSKRVEHTFTTAAMLGKECIVRPHYDGAIVTLGGDIISGFIHEELAKTNEKPDFVAMFEIADILIHGLRFMADNFEKIYVPCVVGNHGRKDRKPTYKNKVFDNIDWIIYNIIARELKSDNRITIDIASSPDILFERYGVKYLLTHGDQFRGGSGISGIYTPIKLGMSRKKQKQQSMGAGFDILLFNHHHQFIDGNNMVGNGSICGYNEFADNNNFDFEPAQQACWIHHPRFGRIYRMPILCEEVKNA